MAKCLGKNNNQLGASLQGFTLIEVLVTVTIVAILSAIALPRYQNIIHQSRQSDVVSQITQIQTTIQAYADEFLAAPSSWDQLARLAPVMGNNGAVTGGNLSAFDSPNGGSYSISAVNSGNTFTITATPKQASLANWNIKACVNISNGVSQVQRGTGLNAAANAICPDTAS